MRRLLALASLCACAGCAAPPPGALPQDLAQRVSPTLASIEREVFAPLCARSACHAGPAPEAWLHLEPGRAYKSLVGVPSQQMSELLRVAPGRSDQSYLVRKLRNDRIVGEPMPNQGERLPPEVIDVIRRWIDAGAPRR